MLAGNVGPKRPAGGLEHGARPRPAFDGPEPLPPNAARSGHLWHCSKSGPGPSNRKAPPFFAACFQISPKYIYRSCLLLKSSLFRLFSLDFLRFKTIVSISPPFVQHKFLLPLTESSGRILCSFHNFYSNRGFFLADANRNYLHQSPSVSPPVRHFCFRFSGVARPPFSGSDFDCKPFCPAYFAEERPALFFRFFPQLPRLFLAVFLLLI